jgi:hypothetical protein
LKSEKTVIVRASLKRLRAFLRAESSRGKEIHRILISAGEDGAEEQGEFG